MHAALLGETQLFVFEIEHSQLVREARQERLAREARAEAKAATATKPATSRGFIPRVAGALGLF